MPRILCPGRRSEPIVINARTGGQRLVFESSELLFEAPNRSPDGDWLIANGDGRLFRSSVAGGADLGRGGSVREHRAFSVGIDQDDDDAGSSLSLNARHDRVTHQCLAGRVVPDAADAQRTTLWRRGP
jgi:hypothetical protein